MLKYINRYVHTTLQCSMYVCNFNYCGWPFFGCQKLLPPGRRVKICKGNFNKEGKRWMR